MFNSGNSTPFTMPVAPAGYGNGNMGGWGDDWIALAIIAMIFGGGRFGFGGGWGGGLGMMEMFLPFMFGGFNGFGGFGGNGSGSVQGEIQRGFDNQSVMNKLNGLEQGVCNLGYENLAQISNLGMTVANGFHGVDNAVCNLGYQTQQGFNSTNMAIAQLWFQNQQCCCETNRNIDSVRFENAQNTCAITNAIHAEGEQTRALINANTMQDLRDKLAEKDRDVLARDFQLSQISQTASIVDQVRPCPQPAYITCNPWGCNMGYGYGFGNGYGNGYGCGNNNSCGCC